MKRFISAIPFPISLVLMCGVLFGVLIVLESVADRREEKTNRFRQLYSIEPEFLLGDIEEGKTGVFFPIDEDPPWPSPDQQIPVPWNQEDYLRITNALFEFIWHDTLTGWQLHRMSFGSSCTNYESGLQYGIFAFFKNEETDGNNSRIERIVNIDSRDKTVYVAENKYDPKLVDWSSIDLNENLLSAQEALQITESVSGREKRLSATNACGISLSLNYDVGLWNDEMWWSVLYSGTDDKGRQTTLFSADINPYSGEMRP